MPDRVPHDHPDVDTLRGTLARRGATNRPEIRLPGAALPTGTARLVLDGTERHAAIEERSDGTLAIRAVRDTPRLVRERSGEDRLAAWARDLDPGRSVLVDVVAENVRYGLRRPGESAVYEAAAPDPGLRDIARQFES
ncbi:MAG: hypothetical protein ABEI39_03315 [Halobacteriales archaeon]